MKFIFQMGYLHSGKTRLRIDRKPIQTLPKYFRDYATFCKYLREELAPLQIPLSKYPKIHWFLLFNQQSQIMNNVFDIYTKTKDWSNILTYVPEQIFMHGEPDWISDLLKYDISDVVIEVCLRDFRVSYILAYIDTRISIDRFLRQNQMYHKIFYSYPKDQVVWIKFEEYIKGKPYAVNDYITEHDLNKLRNNMRAVEEINFDLMQMEVSEYNSMYGYREGLTLNDIIKE
jgi:hypothetical protein